MRMVDNIKTFLYDKEYFINIFNNCIHVSNYLKLLELTSLKITLELENFILEIVGKNLRVKKMMEQEIQIVGEINDLRFIR